MFFACHRKFERGPFIQMYTESPPFSDISNEAAVMFRLISGARPARPSATSGQAIPDTIWSLMQECWSHKISDRPLMSTVVMRAAMHVLNESHIANLSTVAGEVGESSSRVVNHATVMHNESGIAGEEPRSSFRERSRRSQDSSRTDTRGMGRRIDLEEPDSCVWERRDRSRRS
jgi:hypothetical protein